MGELRQSSPCGCTGVHQGRNLGTHNFFKLRGSGTDKLFAGKLLPQANQKSCLWMGGQKTSAHSVNLPLDGVASHGPFRPALGYHRTYPNILNGKQGMGRRVLDYAFAGLA